MQHDVVNQVYVEDIKVEPYWNVNICVMALITLFLQIKVEPYWNVNSK